MIHEPQPEAPSQEVKARLEALLFGQSVRDFTWWKLEITGGDLELKDMIYEEFIFPEFPSDMSKIEKPPPCRKWRTRLTYLQLEVEKVNWRYWVGDLPEQKRVYWARCV